MSEVVTLKLRDVPEAILEVEEVTADRFAALSQREIAALLVSCGKRKAALADFFEVRGERSARVQIEGSADGLARIDGLAAGMTGGDLLIDGGGGQRVAAQMTGGRVEIRGNVGDDAGVAMAGGTLWVRGDAGDRLGAAMPGAAKGMTGGEIVVSGSSGTDAAALSRRSLVVVGGDAGANAGRAMIAGTLVVFGKTGPAAGRWSKRGTIVAVGGIDIAPTYRYACTFRPGYIRVLMIYLRRQHGLDIDDQVIEGSYRRYCGDLGVPGKGEILEREAMGKHQV